MGLFSNFIQARQNAREQERIAKALELKAVSDLFKSSKPGGISYPIKQPGYKPTPTRIAIWHLIISILIAAAITAALIQMALSASAEYCRPFAAHMTDKTIKRIWTTFYATCLNQDENPAEPTDWADIAAIINQSGIGVTPATGTPEPKARPASDPNLGVTLQVCNSKPSGFEAGTIEQTRWCKSNFRSFRPSDGTVVCRHTKRRVPCA